MRKIDKMILGFERHAYAPELNKVVFADGYTMKEEAYNKIAKSKPLNSKMYKHVVVEYKILFYNEGDSKLDYRLEQKSGVYDDIRDIKLLLKRLKSEHNNYRPKHIQDGSLDYMIQFTVPDLKFDFKGGYRG